MFNWRHLKTWILTHFWALENILHFVNLGERRRSARVRRRRTPDTCSARRCRAAGGSARPGTPHGEARALRGCRQETYGQTLANFAKCLQNVCKFLAGSFSAVSKRNFARKYAFGIERSSWKLSPRSTQCTSLHSSKFCLELATNFLQRFCKNKMQTFCKHFAKFC